MGLKVVVVRGRTAGTEIVLEGSEVFVVGSASTAHVRLPDEGVRPEHVRIFVDGPRLIFMDTSAEGVVVNGRNAKQGDLKAGDEILLGRVLLRLVERAPSASAGPAQVLILKGPDEGKQFHVDERTTLGRGTGADFPLLDMKCSREHCAFERCEGGFAVRDLGSTNGTRLNEVRLEPRTPQRLRSGDKIRLGGTVLEFHSPGAVVPPRPAPSAAAPSADATPAGRAFEIDLGGKAFEIDLGELDATPASPAVPIDDSLRRGAVTQRVRAPSSSLRKVPSASAPATLAGDLDKMGFAQVVQFLNLQAKTGELTVRSGTGDFALAFGAGNVVDAWGPEGLVGEAAFHALARLRRGHFEFHETASARPARIKQGTLALLMESQRLIDEATDPGD